MSEEIQKPDINVHKDESMLDTTHEKIESALISSGKDGVVSVTTLDVSTSPKVTVESFSEQSRAKLKDAFFSGIYEDRVYVESLSSYRDRVIVDQEETGFIKSLKSVLKRGKKLQGEQFQGIKSKFRIYARLKIFTDRNKTYPRAD